MLGVEVSESDVNREVEEDHESNLVTPEQNHQVPQSQQTENTANNGGNFFLGYFRPLYNRIISQSAEKDRRRQK